MRHVSMIAALLIVGCQASVDTRPSTPISDPPPPTERRVRSEAETIRDLAQDIQSADDRIEEASALRRMQEYLSDRNLTFNVFAQRAADASTVESLSTQPDPLRVRVDVYRGQQPIQSFTFIPRDNRNLTIIGQ